MMWKSTCLVRVWLRAIAVVLLASSSLSKPSGQLGDSSGLRSNGSRVSDSLKFVAVVSAHGNIAPTFDYADNAYPTNNTEYWPFGPSQLTSVGRNQTYRLGQTIRALYNGFVDQLFDEADFTATTTNADESWMSGLLMTAGLYPPVGYEIWDTDFLWQPIVPYSTANDKTLDIASCARFVEDASVAVTAFETKYKTKLSKVNTFLTEQTGTQVTGGAGLAAVWETFYGQITEGYTLPSWASKVYPSTMKKLTGQYYKEFYAGSNEAVRLLIGTLLGDIITDMDSVMNQRSSSKFNKQFQGQAQLEAGPTGDSPFPGPTGDSPFPGPTGDSPFPGPTGNSPFPGPTSSYSKMVFISSYNASLIALQAALGIANSDIVSPVPAGSALIFELHEDSDTQQYSVEVLILKGEDQTPSLIDIPSCGTSCSYSNFTSLTNQYSNITSYTSECETTTKYKGLQL